MPREAATSTTQTPSFFDASTGRRGPLPSAHNATTVYSPDRPSNGGWLSINPAFAPFFAEIGLDSAEGFLELPGEVVSGHPDRHVVLVHLRGLAAAFYLKRQHIVRRKEKLRNWMAGFGWVSRSEREASILEQLAARGLPCPRWAAVGKDRGGRAFLLVEEQSGAIDLRHLLIDGALTPDQRVALAGTLGRTIAAVHDAGFTTPELTAKHVLIGPDTGNVTLIDWQLATLRPPLGLRPRYRALAALHASMVPDAAAPRECLRVLRAAFTSPYLAHLQPSFHTRAARAVLAESARIADRRSLRDQRLAPATVTQRLVWVAGEAVCAVPEAAATWPRPAIAPPFYGCEPGTLTVRVPGGRDAMLIRGRSVAPVGRLSARVRGRVWRSPGVTLGRMLFHLERYGIPAPRLLAFGQRLMGRMSAEWFALHTSPPGPFAYVSESDTAAKLGAILRRLHDAGCSVMGNPLLVFGLMDGGVCVRDVSGVQIARANGKAELGRLLAALSPWVRKAAANGYWTEHKGS